MPSYVPTFLTAAYSTWKASHENMPTVLAHGGQLYDLVLARWRRQPQINYELQVQELNRKVNRLTQDLACEKAVTQNLRLISDDQRRQLKEFHATPGTGHALLVAEIDRTRTMLLNSKNPRLATQGPLHYLQEQLQKRITRIDNHELLKHATHDDNDPLVLLGDSAAVCPAG